MSLDERGYKILQLIVENPTISGIQVQHELNLSRKQLSYSMDKINYYLNEIGFESLQRLKTGKFVVPKEIIDFFKSDKTEDKTYNFVFTENERQCLMALLLLQHKEELSINYFCYILKVSKNTVLSTMKKLQTTYLDMYQLDILYNRKNGYSIIGTEFNKRMLMVDMIRLLLQQFQGEYIFQNVLGLESSVLEDIKEDLNRVEEALHLQYTDKRSLEIPYIFYFVILRVQSKQFLDILPQEYQHIVGTNEYNSVLWICNKYGMNTQNEKMFIASQLQISSINRSEDQYKNFESDLRAAVYEVLTMFEQLVCIDFKDKQSIFEDLLQHCKPAVYRIRYGYHIETNVLDMILPQHTYLHQLTKKAIKPLEAFINKEFSDEEVAYITILFGGWMTKERTLNIVEQKKQAVVVCTNGVSISNFLFVKLIKTFPEFEFLDVLSARQFYNYKKPFDIVFTTVYLKTDKFQFLVKSIMDDVALAQIRQTVFKQLRLNPIYDISTAQLMDIIEEYCSIHDRAGLAQSINILLNAGQNENSVEELPTKEVPNLRDLLSDSHIQIMSSVSDWKQAIMLAAAPLLEDDIIQPRYIDTIIDQIEHNQPCWNIGEDIIIAHANVQSGVNKLGMSVLKLGHSIVFHKDMKASIIFILATPNQEIHLQALYDLMELIENRSLVNKIKKTNDKKELLKLLKEGD